MDIVAELARRAVNYYRELPAELRTDETNRNRALALVRYGAALRTQSKLEEGGKVLVGFSADQEEKLMEERVPNIVTSGLSRNMTQDGITVELCIYRLEEEAEWTLEVVNAAGTSIVWDDKFSSDDAADEKFLKTVAEEGMVAFLDSAKIIRFPR